MHRSKLALLVVLFLLLISKTSTAQFKASALQFTGQLEIPYNKYFKETTIGGLSGIDYDPSNQIYYLISDDRSAIQRARFYSAKIYFTEHGMDSIRFVDVHKMLQPNGKVYPNAKEDARMTPDPEAIRYNPNTKQLTWTSEGERTVEGKEAILNDPSITVMDLEGKYVDTFPIPSNLTMQSTEKGPRKNGVLEGLSFSPDYRYLFVSSEVPLYEDGPEADVVENKPLTRIYKYDVTSKKNIAQYAYKLDPIAYPAHPPTAFKVNGIPDILAVDDNHLVVIERSFSTGRLPCTVKVFLVDLSKADNVINVGSLKEHPPRHLAQKKLLLNMDDLGIYIDNIEGVTFGPDLPNGHKTLIFAADNNFLMFEKQQLLLFEVIP